METWAYLCWYLILATLAPFGVARLVTLWIWWREDRRIFRQRRMVTPGRPPQSGTGIQWRPGSLPWPGTILHLPTSEPNEIAWIAPEASAEAVRLMAGRATVAARGSRGPQATERVLRLITQEIDTSTYTGATLVGRKVETWPGPDAREAMQAILTSAVADLYREPVEVVAERVREQLAPFVVGVDASPSGQ